MTHRFDPIGGITLLIAVLLKEINRSRRQIHLVGKERLMGLMVGVFLP